MKPINPYTHGYLDYGVGLLLLVAPWLLGFDDLSTVATRFMVIMGIAVLCMSLVTDYPLGVIKAVPFRIHGIMETVGAIFLIISPWILGYTALSSATIFAVAAGLLYLGVIALTNYTEGYSRAT